MFLHARAFEAFGFREIGEEWLDQRPPLVLAAGHGVLGEIEMALPLKTEPVWLDLGHYADDRDLDPLRYTIPPNLAKEEFEAYLACFRC